MMTALTNAFAAISNFICPKPRKVIFLGAGASKDAGYPLTTELYDALEKDNKDSIVVNKKTAWSKFEQSITTIKSEFPLFADCTNIEYLITLLSLTQKFSEQKSLPLSIDDLHNEERMNQIIENSSAASTYESAKMNFARCIESTLGYMDYDMQDTSFKYLADFLNYELKSKDTVITTNYDLLVERCLNSKKLWNAHDGYGFTIGFKGEHTGAKIDSELKQYNSKKSSIKILKLHGSVGWLNGNNKIVLDTSSLQRLIPRGWKDKNYTPNIYDDKHLILPDFLKAYENHTMLEIWDRLNKP